jgi:tetratricopeptide (TPR) repeat protein
VRRAPLALLTLALQGCVYYNGVYNAKHWASQAEASERAGRMLEATDRWRSAEVHADSVIARHPHSRWAGEAYLIRGRALVSEQSFGDAVVALEEATHRLDSREARLEAELALGRANLGLRRLPQALEAFDSAAQSQDARRRSLALLYRGRAHLLTKEPALALEDFRGSREREAPAERARAALALSDMEQAAGLAENAATSAPFDESQWLPLLDSLGRAGLAVPASRVVDLLLLRADVGTGPKARLALADASRRLQTADTAYATERLGEVTRLAPDSVEGRAATLALLRLQLVAIGTTDELAAVHVRLLRIGAQGSQPGFEASALVRSMNLADSLGRVSIARDAFWFFRGVVLRDSLGASTLAAATFAQMADLFPDSPWTPKGLLAAIVLGHPAADSLLALLESRYPASPYAAIALSHDELPGAFAVLEDSLQRALALMPSLVLERDGSAPAIRLAPAIPVSGPRNQPARPTTRPTIDP